MRRKRNILILTILLTTGSAYLLQLSFVNVFFSVGSNIPDLLLILTVFIGIRLGPVAGSVFGFSVGIMQDMMIDVIGLNALCKTVVGYTAQFFGTNRVMLVEKYYFPFVVFSEALIHAVIFYFFVSLDGEALFGNLWYHFGFWNACYSAIISFLWWLCMPKPWIEFVRPVRVYE